MSIKKIFFLGILFTFELLNAQTLFRQGYIIKANGDTLYGKIDYKADLLTNGICLINTDGKELKFFKTDIIAYRFYDDKYFISKELDGENKFVEFLIKGPLNIYYLKDSIGDHYFLEKENVGISEYIYVEEIKHIENEYHPNNPYHKKRIIYTKSIYQVGNLNIFQDAPKYQSKIARKTNLNHRNMVNLAIKYSKKVCKNSNYIIYEKDLFSKIFIFEPSIGGVDYHSLNLDDNDYQNLSSYYTTDDYNNKTYFHKGLFVHCRLSSIRKYLYLRTGVLYSSLLLNNKMTNIYKFPVQIEYNYTKRMINPKFALGFNYSTPQVYSNAYMVGLNIKLNNTFYWSINYDIDFISNNWLPILPEKLYSQCLTTGLQILL